MPTGPILVLGLLAGVLSGMFGIGGGVIMVVGMVQLLRLDFTTATGTSLAAMLLPVGLFGVLEYHRAGKVDIQAALLLALGLAIGAWIGARLATSISPTLVKRGFAVFLVLMAGRMWTTA